MTEREARGCYLWEGRGEKAFSEVIHFSIAFNQQVIIVATEVEQ